MEYFSTALRKLPNLAAREADRYRHARDLSVTNVYDILRDTEIAEQYLVKLEPGTIAERQLVFVTGRVRGSRYSCMMSGWGMEIASEDRELHDLVVHTYETDAFNYETDSEVAGMTGVLPGDNVFRMLYLMLGQPSAPDSLLSTAERESMERRIAEAEEL